MSKETIDMFHELWKFLDETLNSILFLLIGAADLFWHPLDIGWLRCGIIVICTIAISLFARFISVAAPLFFIIFVEWLTGYRLRHRSVRYRGGTIAVLTWAGMRGGISIALALGVPDAFVQHAVPGHMTYGQQIFLMTFTLVVFSICVQGLLFEYVIRMIQALSYEYLEHGGLSTFKSCMSLNMDNPELDTLLPTEEQWERNDSWDYDSFASGGEATRNGDFGDDQSNHIGTPVGRRVLLGNPPPRDMPIQRIPPPGGGHSRFDSTTFAGLDPLQPLPGFSDVLGDIKRSGSIYLSQLFSGGSRRRDDDAQPSGLRRATTMPVVPGPLSRENSKKDGTDSPPPSPAPPGSSAKSGRRPPKGRRSLRGRQRANGGTPRIPKSTTEYGSLPSPRFANGDSDHSNDGNAT
eukprot:Plantae.Rhodophyta-Hildenbrandia_rubra.ctg7627.p1 GENE.Plantae.Rhodophyta-Hildenbrandia_rubra.ctg7627~~Plantae.Rhodophyta-Hildenbrandia_rubra.ctg7627.p1  ORF type:complete len:462 (-),score=66.10 Plantae.Rhodophyta-Hildenbrandia_rubra.ctg7627:1392-2612(-)